MTSGEFWERFGGCTPAQVLASQLRITEVQRDTWLSPRTDGSVMRNGVATPGGGEATDSGEDGASLP